MIPEVIQTSAMDCGPAALKALLGGFGVHVSYGRLREACQTELDGTSIDTLEQVACALGLVAEQVMVPVDHLLLAAARCLPAIVVVQLPAGDTHFVITWRRHRGVVQVMDPGTGRRWPSVRRFLDQLYVHRHVVPAAAWREWAGGNEFLDSLRARVACLGISTAERERLIATALGDSEWTALGRLDAVVRAVQSIVAARGIRRGDEAARTIGALVDPATTRADAIPEAYWSVRATDPSEEGTAQLAFHGAVVVRVRGMGTPNLEALATPELAAAATEAPVRPGREILRFLGGDRAGRWVGIVAPLVLAAAGVVLEAVLLRSVFNLGRELGLVGQRSAAAAALLLFAGTLLLLEVLGKSACLRLGRRLEVRLRMAFLEKISRLGDRYFQSRPISDMAERSHNVHRVRLCPDLGGQIVRGVAEAMFTAAGLVWLAPSLAPLVALATAVAVGLPLLVQPVLIERDLRVRTHAGGLVRFYLDALAGLVAVRTHGAERAIRREHEGLLVEWARAGVALTRAIATFDGVHSAVGFGLGAALLVRYVAAGGEPAGVLLLVYWALNLPAIGQDIAAVAWQYPALRNLTLRVLEPLGAPEETLPDERARPGRQSPAAPGVAISFEDVSVIVSGHHILREVSLDIAPGTHVAIVGRSGAGKSSLVGLLLGWHRPATGVLRVDGEVLDGAGLDQLRGQTAWVDPAVQLWNRTLIENLCYGARPNPPVHIGAVIDAAVLRGVVQRLPRGMAEPLGEGGGLVSGGEGQRVRFGRAMLRPNARLIVLDEPFRGLDRERRSSLLARARGWWPGATLLCVTHDVGETVDFPRVLVVEDGRIVEDGTPGDLAADPASRYRALLEAERAVRTGLWSSETWRQVRVADGRVTTSRCEDAS